MRIEQEILDHFPRNVKTLEEASEGYLWISRFYLSKEFGKAYVDNVFKAVEGTKNNPILMISEALNAEDRVYDVASRTCFVAAAMLAPDWLVVVENSGDGFGVISAAAIVAQAVADKYVFFHSMTMRPGLGEFQATLEYTHYTPCTPANDKYKVFYTAMPPRDPEAMLCTVIGVPKEDEPLAEAAAITSGLRFSKDEVAQCMMTSSGVHQCPINGKNIYALTNLTGHGVYDNKDFYGLIKADNAEAIRLAKEAGFDIGRRAGLT